MSGRKRRSWVLGILALHALAAVAAWLLPRAKSALDRALDRAQGAYRSCLARDAYSLGHFPVLCGVIAYAAAIEEAIAHPVVPLPFVSRLALAAGAALFVGGLAVPLWRATGGLWLPRVLVSAATAVAAVAVTGVPPALTLGIVFLGIAAIAIPEQRRQPAADRSLACANTISEL